MIQHLEAGGITNILYGGNANFYHIAPSEYAEALHMLQDNTGTDTWVIPSAGPTFGVMIDQARVLREFAIPTAMDLHMSGLMTFDGVEEGFKRLSMPPENPLYLHQIRRLHHAICRRSDLEGRIRFRNQIRTGYARPHDRPLL